MRIAHVITRLILGGAQENTLLTCEGLAARGHEVSLLTGPALGPEGQLFDRALAGGYRVEVIDALRRPIRPSRDAAAYRAVRRLLRELAPTLVHTHSSKAGILARRAAARCGAPIVVHTIHGLPFHPYQSWWLRRLFIAMERRAARHTDAIVSVADAMTRQALAAGVGEPEQFTTIYSGMEVEPFLHRRPDADAFRDRLGLPPGTVLVTQVSRLAELKGHRYLIAAAAALPPNVHVCLVGDGRRRRTIERQIAASSLTGRFHLTGLLAPSMIPAAMHASDIVVHCSLREGLARALPQAMLAGRPVVAYNVDGAAEVVADGRTGFLLPPKAVAPLASAIERLAGDEGLRSRLGRAGREQARGPFAADTMVERIEQLYGTLAQRKPT